MRVPEIEVQGHDGKCVSIRELAKDRPLALVLLRHLGCVFCREQVASLRDALPNANIAFVTMSDPARSARFRTWIRSPHLFLSDPDRKLYQAFGLSRGSFGQIFSPHTALRGISALRKGNRPGRLIDDPWQLGGTFVVDGTGTVTAAFPAVDAGDHPSPEVICASLG